MSVSLDEALSRPFTINGDLEWEDDDIGAPNQCCMIRVSLLPGTPYLDMDTALKNSNGWGFALGEKEWLLPPGLKWVLADRGVGGESDQPANFPEEIYERYSDGGLTIVRSFNVQYYTVGPPGS